MSGGSSIEKAEQDRKDAERYRKLKDKYSPFLVRNVQIHGPFDAFISPHLDAALDAWQEDVCGDSEWNKPVIEENE